MKTTKTFLLLCLSVIIVTLININTVRKENSIMSFHLGSVQKVFADGESGTPCYRQVSDEWEIGDCHVFAQDCWSGTELTYCLADELMLCPPPTPPTYSYHEYYCP